jgi:adenine phosphoribosyltransferase
MSFEAAHDAAAAEKELRRAITDVPDFPKPGIIFKDITGLLLDPRLLHLAIESMASPFARDRITHVVGIESRGFILGAPVALALGAGFVPMRKPGKLPSSVERAEYGLEYGVDALEVHRDALRAGHRVLVVDDVLATGGTARAACDLVSRLGAEVVGCSFLLALDALGGAEKLGTIRREVVIRF